MDEELRAYLDAMRSEMLVQFAGVLARISNIEERMLEGFDAVRDDLTVLGGANDGLRQSAGHVRDELTALARNVGDMQRVLLKHGTRLDRLERGQ